MKSFIKETIKLVLFIFLIVLPIRYFVFQAFVVKGASMEDNFYNGEYLVIDELSLRWDSPNRGEVVVFKSPNNCGDYYIKRVVGLPGEEVKVKDGTVFIYSETAANWSQLDETGYLISDIATPGEVIVSLGIEEYFVLGDNRGSSFDSRFFGSIKKQDIIGRIWLRAWPFKSFKKF